jgi:DNA-binding PadR family transcriptional regulator
VNNQSHLQKFLIELRKGFSKPLILYALNKFGQSYPYPLKKKIEELTKNQISIAPSNMYPMLKTLVEENLVSSEVDEKDRKYYFLTEQGKSLLKDLDIRIKEFLAIILDVKT